MTLVVQLEASDAATNPSAPSTETLVPRKRGRPSKAQNTTASIATESKTPLDTAPPSLERLTDPQALPTAIPAQIQPGLPSPPPQAKKPTLPTFQQQHQQPSIGTAESIDETLEGIKRAVGCQNIPDEEFQQHLERLNPTLLGDVLAIKRQLQALSRKNQAGPANNNSDTGSIEETAAGSRSAVVAKETKAPDAL